MPESVALEPLDHLAMARTAEERALLLQRNPALAHPHTVQALYDRVAQLLRVDLSEAERAAHSLLWLAEYLGHPESLALSFRGLGNVELLQGQSQSALTHFSKALKLFESEQKDNQAAQTQLNLLAAHLSLGDYDSAHAVANTARKLLTDLEDPLGIARLDNNLGSLLFRQEDYLQAREHWRSALDTFRRLGHSHDAAIALRNLAVCEISLNNFRSALEIYNEVSLYCKEHNLPLLLHEIEYNIAYLYFLRGDHDRALDGYRLARARSLEYGDSYHAALCDLDEAELYLELNLLPDAIGLAERASAAFDGLGKAYEAAKALAFHAIGTARLGNDHRALELLRGVHEAFSSQGHLAWASLTLLYQSLVFLREGRRFEARRSALLSLEGFRQLENHGKCAVCEIVLGRLSLEADDLAAAQLSAEAAIDLVRSEELPHVLFQGHLLLGDIREAGQDLQSARTHYYKAVKLLQSIRTEVFAADLHIPLPQGRLAAYDRLLYIEGQLLAEEALPTVAFSLMEQERARTVSDLLGSRASSIGPSQPARSRLVEQVRGLREELRWYYKKMSQREMLAKQRSESTQTPSFYEMERKILASLTEIAKEDREFGHLNQTISIEMAQVQELLRDDEVVLEYFVGDDVVTLLVVSRKGSTCQPVAVSSEVGELRRLIDFQASRLDGDDYTVGRRRRSSELARHSLSNLYQELVGPVFDQIKGYRSVKVVPHGFLTYLPFHAFVAGDAGDADFGDLFTLSYAPSIASLFFGRRRLRGDTERVALVFPEVSHDHAQEALRDSGWQLKIVAPGTARDEWQRRLRAPSAVVHLPLHANYRLDNPALSGISIAGSQLTLLDLFQMEVQAEVVVATACSPPPSTIGVGDELLCLSRGLLYSGPRALVLPLRQSRVAPRTAVLKRFYSALALGRPADEALRQAQAACKTEFPHMADWAPLAVYGL